MLLNPLKRSMLAASEHYSYRGVPMQKNPIDLAIYSMLLWDLKPKTIIEIGSKDGGSAMWFADQCSANIYSVDLQPPPMKYKQVNFIKGDAKNLAFLHCNYSRPWLVIEDSSHDYGTTLAVLAFFDRHVVRGDYVVVEDIHVTAVEKAVKYWLSTGRRYRIDHHYQDFWGFSDHAYMKVNN